MTAASWRDKPWAVLATVLLLMGQAALSLASTPCACRDAGSADSAAHACCCGHAPEAPCPCSPHGGGFAGGGSCAHDAATLTAASMGEAPPHAVAPPPSMAAATAAAIPTAATAQHRVAPPEPAGGPPPSQRLASLRATILRN